MTDIYMDLPINESQKSFFLYQQAIATNLIDALVKCNVDKDFLTAESCILFYVRQLEKVCQLSPYTFLRLAMMYASQKPSDWVKALYYAKTCLPACQGCVRLPVYHGLDSSSYLAETRFFEPRKAEDDDIILPLPSNFIPPDYHILMVCLKDDEHVRLDFHVSDDTNILGEYIGG